jgi:hypothetical protein
MGQGWGALFPVIGVRVTALRALALPRMAMLGVGAGGVVPYRWGSGYISPINSYIL